jgi:Uma2 family endonuclease
MERSSVHTRRWSRAEYERLIDKDVFQPGERLELVGGQLVVREPQRSPHATAIELALDALQAAFGRGWRVRIQMPVALDDESEPEPDVAVVPGGPRDYLSSHPTRPALIVEVAETTLTFDRDQKGGLYARAGIADYWIINLVDRVLEVHRDPAPAPDAAYGWRYRSVATLWPRDVVSPLAAPRARISITDLLP